MSNDILEGDTLTPEDEEAIKKFKEMGHQVPDQVNEELIEIIKNTVYPERRSIQPNRTQNEITTLRDEHNNQKDVIKYFKEENLRLGRENQELRKENHLLKMDIAAKELELVKRPKREDVEKLKERYEKLYDKMNDQSDHETSQDVRK